MVTSAQMDAFAPTEPPREDPAEGCTRLCREAIEAEPDVGYRELYARCRQRWPGYVEGLSVVRFHALHCLPAKKELHR